MKNRHNLLRSLDQMSFNELYVNDKESRIISVIVNSLNKFLLRHQEDDLDKRISKGDYHRAQLV